MLSLEAHDGASTVDVDSVTTPRHSEEYCHQPKPCIARLDRDDSDFTSGVRRECLQENNMDEVADYNCSSHSMASLGDQLSGQANDYSNPPISPRRATPDSRSRTFPTASIMDEHNMDNIRSYTHNDHQHRRSSRNRSLFVRNQQSSTLQEPEQRAFGHGKSTSSSSSRSASSIFVPPGHSHTNTLGPSSLSSWMGRQEWSPSAILAKEKELAIQQTKLLALSSLAESVATNSSQAKQGFYGKQLKLIGKISPSGGAADFEMIVKLHVLENRFTCCQLLPSSTLLQQWEVLEQHLKPDTEGSESAKTAPATSLGDYISKTNIRRHSFSSASSFGSTSLAETHVATMSNALCFITNRAGDYLIKLSFRVRFVPPPLDNSPEAPQGVHLSLIPKCRCNFLVFNIESSSTTASSTSSPALNTTTGRDSDISDIGEGEDESLSSEDKTEKNPAKGVKHDAMFEFKVHPSIVSLEEAYLNPDSDEDAQFWLAAQELVAQGRVVEKLLDALGEKDNAGAQEEDGHSASLRPPGNWNQIAGCFQPSSSLHISWMPKNACKFVTNVQQEVHVHLTTKVEPPTITSSLFTGQKRRQNPEEDVQLLVSSDDDEDDEEEEEDDDDESIIGGLGRRLVPAAAAATNSNVALLLESSCTLTVRKLGWKLPFVDVQIHGLPASIQETLLEGKSKRQETLKISGEAVQDWENISPVPGSQEPIFRISLFSGTEGQMIVRVILQVDQLPPTRLTKAGGALLTIPKIEFLGAHEIESRIRIVAGDGLYVRPASPSLQPIAMQDWPLEDCLEVAPQGAILQYYYSQLDPEKLLSVYTSQYQSIARIERIERVHVDLGMSELSKPAYVHVQLHDVVVGNEAGFLRVSNLVSAHLPRLPSSLTYGEPLGELRTLSYSGGRVPLFSPSPSFTRTSPLENEFFDPSIPLLLEKRATVYGVFMSNGLPELKIPLVPVATPPAITSAPLRVNETTEPERQLAQQQSTRPLNTADSGPAAISAASTLMHPPLHAHDPQQPPPGTQQSRRTLFHSHQRHPQETYHPPPFSSNRSRLPEAYEAYSSNDEDDMSPTTTQTISLQAPSIIRPGDPLATANSEDLHARAAGSPSITRVVGPAAISEEETTRRKTSPLNRLRDRNQYRGGDTIRDPPKFWWRQIVVVLVSLAMVILLLNAASFQDLGLSPFISWNASFERIMSTWWKPSTLEQALPRGIEGTRIKESATGGSVTSAATKSTENTNPTTIEKVTMATPTVATTSAKVSEGGGRMVTKEKVENLQRDEQIVRATLTAQTEYKSGDSRLPFSSTSTTLYPMPVQQQAEGKEREPGMMDKAKGVFRRAIDSAVRWWRRQWMVLISRKRIEAGTSEKEGRE